MPVGFDTVDFTGILNYFLSEHKADRKSVV